MQFKVSVPAEGFKSHPKQSAENPDQLVIELHTT